MATCRACHAEIEQGDPEIGETVTCGECGADMEVIGVHPLEVELIEHEDLDEDEEDPDEEEDEADC